MNISFGLIRQCLLAGMASLVFSGATEANILPVDADHSSEKNAFADNGNRFAGIHSGQRLTTDPQGGLLANKSATDDTGKHFEITYQLLAQLGSLETITVPDTSSSQPSTPGMSLFQRIVLDESDQRDFLDTAILATLLLLIGGIGYAQHLAKKHREQPKRRPLFPA